MTEAERTAGSDPRSLPVPSFTWGDLERELLALRRGTHAAEVIPHMIRAGALTTQWLPPDGVLREVCLIAWAAMSEELFPPTPSGGRLASLSSSVVRSFSRLRLGR